MNTDRIPDWKLERFILGELPQSELNAISERELSDPNLRERLELLRKDNAESLQKYPLSRMIRDVKSPPRPVRSVNERRFSLWENLKNAPAPRWAAPVFACLLAILPMYLLVSTPPKAESLAFYAEETRAKGLESRLEVWRKNGASAEKLNDEDGVSQGDVIQLRYLVPAVCYGTIISLDGRGVITVHLSESGKAVPLTPGRVVALNQSYQLDDAPNFETFYLVTSSRSFDINSITQSIKKVKNPNDPPALPDEQHVTVFTLLKHILT